MTRHFLGVWLLWGVVLIILRGGESGLQTGWLWNDSHILAASDWFKQNGHWQTLGLPPRQTAPKPDGTWELYNTYPPGVFWLHEIRRGLGVEALWAHRVCMVVWNHVSVLLMFLLIRRWTASAAIAAVSAGLYMFSGPYATGAGGLWEHAPMLSLFATLLAWTNYERARGPRRANQRRMWLGLTLLLFAFDNLLTIQNASMIGLLIGVRSLWLARRHFRRRRLGRPSPSVWVPLAACALMFAVPPAVMAVRFAAQAHLMGGVEPALRYFRSKAVTRSGVNSATDEATTVWPLVSARLGFPFGSFPPDARSVQGWYPAFATLALVGAGFLTIAAWMVRRSPSMAATRRGLLAGCGLLAGATTWPLLFPQHAIVHSFVTFMFMPGAATLSATFATMPPAIRRAAWASGQPRRGWARPLLWLASLAVILPPVSSLRKSQALNAWFELDADVAETVRDRKLRGQIIRNGAAQLAGAPLVELIGGVPIALDLGLPFRRLLDSPKGFAEEPSDDQLVAIATNEPSGQQILNRTVPRRGLPRYFTDPGFVAVFGGPDAPRMDRGEASPDVLVQPGLTWRVATFAPTLDGAAYVCLVLLEGNHALTVHNPGPFLRVQVLDANGRTLAEREVNLRRASISETRIIAPIQVPAATVAAWDRVEVSVGANPEERVRAEIRRNTQ